MRDFPLLWYLGGTKSRTPLPLLITGGSVNMGMTMTGSCYKVHSPMAAVRLGFITSTLFEFIPADAVVRVYNEYQETGVVELHWADASYMTYLETLNSHAKAVHAESHGALSDAIRKVLPRDHTSERVRAAEGSGRIRLYQPSTLAPFQPFGLRALKPCWAA